jgi:CARDB
MHGICTLSSRHPRVAVEPNASSPRLNRCSNQSNPGIVMNARLLALTVALSASTLAFAQPQKLPVPSQVPQINPNILKSPLTNVDLTVMSIKPRMLNGAPYAYVCVKNSGSSASAAFDVELSMQAAAPTGSPPISWATLVGTMRYPSVSAGGGFACNDFRLPGNHLPNCVKYNARADSRSEVSESNEGNNSLQVAGTCLIEPPKGPASFPIIRRP